MEPLWIEIPLHLQLNVGSDSLSSSSRVRVGTSLRTLRGGARDRVLRRVKAGFHPIVKAWPTDDVMSEDMARGCSRCLQLSLQVGQYGV